MARITVVNDYPDFIEMMTSILDEMAGYEVTGLDAADATVEALAATHPDLLIVDPATADMVFGLGAPLDQRTAGALGPVPIVVCSGDNPALRERGDEFGDLGNVYTLDKPFTLEMLTDAVKRALSTAARARVA
jgi:CheY-like chemotaxis protein